MVKESKPEIRTDLVNYYYRISVKFNHIVKPFNGFDFTSVLERLGYSITVAPPPPSVIPPVNSTMGFLGTIGVKDQFTFDINSEKQFFGLMGPDIQSILT